MNLATSVKVFTTSDQQQTAYVAEYNRAVINEEIISHDVSVSYQLAAGTEQTAQEQLVASTRPWRFRLSEYGPIVPGSVVLDIGGELWFDDGDGRLLRNYDTTTGVGTALGTINYSNTEVEITNYDGRPLTATVTPIAILIGDDWSVIKSATFRTAAAPLRPNGFTVRGDDFGDGTQYNGEADNQGTISGDGISGEVNLQNGIAEFDFPAPVLASTLFYNMVAFKQIPLDPDILGLDPVRLPADGRVPILRDADILVLTHTQKDLINSPAADLVVDAGRDKLHAAWIEDDEGVRLDPAMYALDKEAGTATLANPFTAQDSEQNPLTGDLHFVHRIDDMALCTEARIDGSLQLAQPLYHDFPANDTWVASAVYLGDLQARVRNWASYTVDPGDYESEGTPTTANYNLIAYPVAIDNKGSVPERWKIKFTSTTAFELYGEQRGLVATGSTNADFSPTNPQTGTPYFTILADGWGSGWSVGNTARFETEAAAAPMWMIRTVLPGQATVDDDQIKIELRGDHN